MVIYCGYPFKQLIGGFSFGWFLIVILKWISFCVRRAKEFKVLKCLVNIFVQFVSVCVVITSLDNWRSYVKLWIFAAASH